MMHTSALPITQTLKSCEAAIQGAPPYLNKQQVRHLWDAGSFLVQEYGLLFNVRLTLVHDQLGVFDQAESVALISELIHELGLRLKYWYPLSPFHWLYVHENTTRQGRVTTIIAHIPEQLLGDAEYWLLRRFLGKRFGAFAGRSAVRFACTPQLRDANLCMRRHLQLMQMICRSTDPAIRVPHLEQRRALVDVLAIRNRSKEVFQSLSGHRFRISESLGKTAQTKASREGMEMLSAFGDKAFHRLLTGWERHEHQDRQRTKVERARELAKIDVEWPKGESQRQDQVRQITVDRLHDDWRSNPKRRLRTWTGWWLEPMPPDGELPE